MSNYIPMKQVLAEIMTIGDEILYGQILDTNTQWMSAELDKIGIRTVRKTTVGDEEGEILKAFAEAEARASIVLITGGLGPTSDDLTKPLLARYFDSSISINPQALKDVTELFSRMGRELTELNRQQAALPDKCQMISNKLGTAPGMWFERNGKIFISMPGVPYEMKAMMENFVIHKLQKFFSTPIIYHKMIKTVGIGESWLADMIKDWENQLPAHIRLAYLPNLGQVRLRLTATGSNLAALQDEVAQEVQKFMPLAGKYVYGFDEETLESAVGKILKDQKKTISVAESCTGGALASLLTGTPGSSAYFQGAVVPYHNELKINVLGVSRETLAQHGAVSEETVIEMANNVRKMFGTDIGAASSGIAGPGGGTPEKPVGTVWIAFADGKQTIAKKLALAKNREINIKLTCIALLDLIRQNLKAKV